ncbi:alpha/beta hydrolase [Millisia brevis]|uniref:alpha/beta hydrolase n=1 Tax=Millisia brevis TaxID=264148 RepID=UPI000834A700|nr:alpha/beta hydrolase [Millisia brevis]
MSDRVSAFSENVARGLLRALANLPGPVLRAIAGRPIEVDGRRLFTEVQVFLRLANLAPPRDLAAADPEHQRVEMDLQARIFGGHIPVDHVEDITIPTRDGQVPARVYRAQRPLEPHGTVVYYHGGGWVVGGLESADATCRFIATNANVTVISVEYRLAPEHPFPAAVHDAIDSYLWVRRHPLWGSVVAVAGDSAGGNLAAVVSQATVDAPDGGPDFQLLYYPATDMSVKRQSYSQFSSGFMLTESNTDWYKQTYLGDPELASDPQASPLLGSVVGVAPAHVVVAGFDVLRDEGIAYAELLRANGVAATLQEVTGHVHGFVNVVAIGTEGEVALRESLAALTAGLLGARRAETVLPTPAER